MLCFSLPPKGVQSFFKYIDHRRRLLGFWRYFNFFRGIDWFHMTCCRFILHIISVISYRCLYFQERFDYFLYYIGILTLFDLLETLIDFLWSVVDVLCILTRWLSIPFSTSEWDLIILVVCGSSSLTLRFLMLLWFFFGDVDRFHTTYRWFILPIDSVIIYRFLNLRGGCNHFSDTWIVVADYRVFELGLLDVNSYFWVNGPTSIAMT